MMTQTILVVDDEVDLRKKVSESLERESYRTVLVGSGTEAIRCLQEEGIDLILLDVGLPDCSGFQLHHEIRAVSNAPVIFMTARDAEADKVAGLEQGADDYLVKPMSMREMVARVRSVLRRFYGNSYRLSPGETPPLSDAEGDAPTNQDPPWIFDQEKKQLTYFGVLIPLTKSEYLIFEMLYESIGKVVRRDRLLSCLGDHVTAPFERAIDRHINSIRAKLNVVNDEIEVIETVRGFGFSLKR
jgi:two-component system catabolic regulation response regulator CreB